MGSPKNELCKAVATTLLVLRQARLPIRPGEVIAETLNSAFETFLNQDADEYGLVSEQVKHSLKDYAENRRAPGGFLMSVLENNLSRAVAEADGQNFPAIPQISKWIYNKLPSACWGSPEKVANWLAHEFQIDEQGETEILSVRNGSATCPFCKEAASIYITNDYGTAVALRDGHCLHAVLAEAREDAAAEITFHRSAAEKGGSK